MLLSRPELENENDYEKGNDEVRTRRQECRRSFDQPSAARNSVGNGALAAKCTVRPAKV